MGMYIILLKAKKERKTKGTKEQKTGKRSLLRKNGESERKKERERDGKSSRE